MKDSKLTNCPACNSSLIGSSDMDRIDDSTIIVTTECLNCGHVYRLAFTYNPNQTKETTMKHTEKFIHAPFPRDMPFRGEAKFLKMRGFTLKLVQWDDMTALEAYTFIGAEKPVITVYSYKSCDMINIQRGNRCWHGVRPTAGEVITELISCAKQYEKYIA